jgi:3-hydroxyethyl bacteriochlorophyllide a dehydrogenase
LLTHTQAAEDAHLAYEQAFGDAACLKMVLDWRHHA